MAKSNWELKVDSKFQRGKIHLDLLRLGAKNVFFQKNKRYEQYIKFTAPNDKIATDIKTMFGNIKETQ